jgi:hypothetical protein
MSYTKKGFKLIGNAKLLDFSCVSERVSFQNDRCAKYEAEVGRLMIFVPCTKSEVINQLTCWLSSFHDDELLASIETVVNSVLKEIPTFIETAQNSQNKIIN